MKYLYGPVKSRRLGLSLGVSLTPYKSCSFDCVYCQLGKTTNLTVKRKEYINIGEILRELKFWFAENALQAKRLNYVTFSGMGEPTLNTKIGELISGIKKFTPVSVAVITNSSCLIDFSVRQAIKEADLIVPSLDAASQSVFKKIDRPEKQIKINSIIDSLVSLRKEFTGKIWLEVMLIKGVNDDLAEIKKIKKAIDRIKPDKIQLNSPVRKTAEPGIFPVDENKLQEIKKLFGEKCEIV